MRRLRLKAHTNIFTYNLFIRAIRDCDFGSPEFAQDLIKRGRAAKLLKEGTVRV